MNKMSSAGTSLGLVGAVAIAGIVLLILQLIKHPPDPSKSGVCRSFVPIGKNAKDVVNFLKGHDAVERVIITGNPFYANDPTEAHMAYDQASEQWGYCRGDDPTSGRIVAEGKFAEHAVSKGGCKTVMGDGWQISDAKMAPLVNRLRSSAVEAPFDTACGCRAGYEWPVSGMRFSKRDRDGGHGCRRLPDGFNGKCSGNDEHGVRMHPEAAACNDEGQYRACACKGCPGCWNTEDHTCSCRNVEPWCISLASKPQDWLPDMNPVKHQEKDVKAVPMSKGSSDASTLNGCGCGGDLVRYEGTDASDGVGPGVAAQKYADKLWLVGDTSNKLLVNDPCYRGLKLNDETKKWEVFCDHCKTGNGFTYERSTSDDWYCCHGDPNNCELHGMDKCDPGAEANFEYCAKHCPDGHGLKNRCAKVVNPTPSGAAPEEWPDFNSLKKQKCCPNCQGLYRSLVPNQGYAIRCCVPHKPIKQLSAGEVLYDKTCQVTGWSKPSRAP